MDANDVKSIFMSILGPFAGAFSAFKLESKRRESIKEESEDRIIKWAQYCLLYRKHVVDNLYKEFKQYEKSEERHMAIKRIDLVSDVPDLNLDKLLFLSNGKSSSIDLFYELFVFNRKFLNFTEILKKRNEFYESILYKEATLSDEERQLLTALTDTVYAERKRLDFEGIMQKFSHYIHKNFPTYQKSLFLHKSPI